MKKICLCSVGLLALLVMSGCQSTKIVPAITKIEAVDQEAILKYNRECGELALKALKNGNFKLIEHIEVGAGENRNTIKFFDLIRRNIAAVGGIENVTYLGFLEDEKACVGLWKVTWNPMKAAVDKDGKIIKDAVWQEGQDFKLVKSRDLLFAVMTGKVDGKFKVLAWGFRM